MHGLMIGSFVFSELPSSLQIEVRRLDRSHTHLVSPQVSHDDYRPLLLRLPPPARRRAAHVRRCHLGFCRAAADH